VCGEFKRLCDELNHYRFSTRHKVIRTALGPVDSTLSPENSYNVLNTDPELVNRAFTVFGSAIQPPWPLDRSDATQMARTTTMDEAKQYGCERFEFVVDAAARVVQPATPPVIIAFYVLINRPVDFLPSPDLSHGLTGVRLLRKDLLVHLRQNEAFFATTSARPHANSSSTRCRPSCRLWTVLCVSGRRVYFVK
jgi:hypothetical protein